MTINFYLSFFLIFKKKGTRSFCDVRYIILILFTSTRLCRLCHIRVVTRQWSSGVFTYVLRHCFKYRELLVVIFGEYRKVAVNL